MISSVTTKGETLSTLDGNAKTEKQVVRILKVHAQKEAVVLG
jgi:hypothetical protein